MTKSSYELWIMSYEFEVAPISVYTIYLGIPIYFQF